MSSQEAKIRAQKAATAANDQKIQVSGVAETVVLTVLISGCSQVLPSQQRPN